MIANVELGETSMKNPDTQPRPRRNVRLAVPFIQDLNQIMATFFIQNKALSSYANGLFERFSPCALTPLHIWCAFRRHMINTPRFIYKSSNFNFNFNFNFNLILQKFKVLSWKYRAKHRDRSHEGPNVTFVKPAAKIRQKLFIFI